MIKLSVIVPTYNESANLPTLLAELQAALEGQEFEVIIVDDNSPDRTWEVAEGLRSRFPGLRVLRRTHERGLSSAVLEGFRHAQGELLAVMDGDLQHDPAVLLEFIRAYGQGAGIVVGSRHVQGGSQKGWGKLRSFVSFVANQAAFLLLGRSVRDPMSGYFAIGKRIASELSPQINPRGFKILLEFIARAPKHVRIEEVGFQFRNRLAGKSKLSSAVILDYLVALVSLSPLGRVLSAEAAKYALVGATGIAVSQATLWACRHLGSMPPRGAYRAAIELSVLTNFVFNELWTFRERCTPAWWFRRLVVFHAVCFSGAFLHYAVSTSLNELQGWNFYLAHGCGFLVASIWNCFVNSDLTWKTRSAV